MKWLYLLFFLLSLSQMRGEEEEKQPPATTETPKKETEDEEARKANDDEQLPAQETPENYTDTKWTGNWWGRRDFLRDKGIVFTAQLYLADIWNLDGGIRPTPFHGAFLNTYILAALAKSDHLLGYEGGSFYAKVLGHHGQNPSTTDVGSYMFVNYYEAPSFDVLYSLWYKQNFGDNFWILAGKTDAYDNFTIVAPVANFLNAGYTQLPSCPLFPTYPDPAMSLIGSVTSGDLTLTLGVFDGSLVNGPQINSSVFGHFFDGLHRHAFLIGEVDWGWKFCQDLEGRLGLGIWKHTANFKKYSGANKNGTEGAYLTFAQTLSARRYPYYIRKLSLFSIWGVGDPAVSPVHYYTAVGGLWEGINCCRLHDSMGIAMSRVDFTDAKEAGFTKGFETVYEIFYYWRLTHGLFLEPDFQYIVHPGGQGLPNASVFSLQLECDF